MTVQELINQLQQYPSEKRVVVQGYEGGFNDILEIKDVSLLINYHKAWYYGAHEEPKEGQEADEVAVLLFGENDHAEEGFVPEI